VEGQSERSRSIAKPRIGLARVVFRRGAIGSCLGFGLLIASTSASLAQKNGLLSHDINGFSLDMTVQQVAVVAHEPLSSLGGGQYQVNVDGIDYNFGFSVLGHLFRIDSKQQLGHFIPDGAFAATLTNKLSKKFGPPQLNQLPGGPASWEFLEVYTNPNGQSVNRTTESLSAMLGGGWGQPISLEMKLIDFRIMRRDIAKLNATPRSRAQSDVKF
jgi:hypothetical protein